ncbi:MAG TPA: dihydrodipicolinate synthase family protein [Acidobacteriota bacterium]|jgi:4-hydroxy-tetrahydrodipicolinate synthase
MKTSNHPDLKAWRARLRGALLPAVPVPFTERGEIDGPAHGAYTAYMSGQPLAGVAVWAHTGRGLRLTRQQRREVLTAWRSALSQDKTVVAGVGASPEILDPKQHSESAVGMAAEAASLGADALLVHPPTIYRGRLRLAAQEPKLDPLNLDSNEASTLKYHQQVAAAGLPLIVFYLYEAAGGICYSPRLLRKLLSMPEVVAVKMATLDSVTTFQDVARIITEEFPEKTLITGEDRFLGYSLMCGAQAALIGMGAVCVKLQHALLQAFFNGDAAQFLQLSRVVDTLAQALFIHPMEGYIRRTLCALAHLGVLPQTAVYDPWGPSLNKDEFQHIGQVLRLLGEWAQ